MPGLTDTNYYSIAVSYEMGKLKFSKVALLVLSSFQLFYLVSLEISMYLRISFSISTKGHWNFDRDCIKSLDSFGQDCGLNNLSLLIH